MFIKLDKDYEVVCTLGTIREIETRFRRSFYALMRELDQMTASEQLKLIWIGVQKADKSVSEQAFYALCDEYLGIGALTDILERYLYQLQYPGMNADEIQEKVEKKLAAAKARETRLSTGGN